MWKISTVILAMYVLTVACAHKPANKGPARHFRLTGKVLSVNGKDQTASIDAAAIPDYMEAMTMSYPIANKSDLDSLHQGDQIQATVNVYDSGDYDLSAIKKISRNE